VQPFTAAVRLLRRPNKKRQFKNDKFGFGGQKKRTKQNTKQSADDMSSFSVRRNAAQAGKHKNRKAVGTVSVSICILHRLHTLRQIRAGHSC